jgi:hypothetical protein
MNDKDGEKRKMNDKDGEKRKDTDIKKNYDKNGENMNEM